MALVMKTGTFSDNTTIETGLSSIKLITFYRTSIASTSGVLSASWHETAGQQLTSVTYQSYMSTLGYSAGASIFTINGGSVTYTGNGSQAIASGLTYTWIAYGEE